MKNVFGEVKTRKKEKVVVLLQPEIKRLEEQIPCSSHKLSFDVINGELMAYLTFSDEKEYTEVMNNEIARESIARLLKVHCAITFAGIIPKLAYKDKVPSKINVHMDCSYEPSKYSTEI